MPVTKGNKKTMTCTRCGKVAPTDTLFYASRSPKYEYFGRIPICKDCVTDIYTEIFEKTQDRKTSIINFCAALDVPFAEKTFEQASSRFLKEYGDGSAEHFLVKMYMSLINSAAGKMFGNSFLDSENFSRILAESSDDLEQIKTAHSDLKDSAIELQDKISLLENEKVELTAAINKLTRESQTISNNNVSLENSNEQFKELNRKLNETIKQITESNRQLNETNRQLTKDVDTFKDENFKLQTRLTSAESKLDTANFSIQEEIKRREDLRLQMKAKLDQAALDLSDAKNNIAELNRRLKEESSNLEKEKADLVKERANSGRLQVNLDKLEVELSSKTSRLEDGLNKIAELRAQLAEATKQISELNKQINDLNKQNLSAENRANSAEQKLTRTVFEKEQEVQSCVSKYDAEKKILEDKISELNLQIEEIRSDLEIEKNKPKMEATEKEKEEDKQEEEIIPEDYIFEWGEGFTLKEYEFLNRELENWNDKYKSDIENGAQDILSREICVEQLNIRRKRALKDDTSKEVKSIQSLINTGKFVARKVENPNTSVDLAGLWAKDIEDYNPAEWINDKKKFKDIDGIDDYIKNFIIRPIRNFITGSRDFDPEMDLLSKDDEND